MILISTIKSSNSSKPHVTWNALDPLRPRAYNRKDTGRSVDSTPEKACRWETTIEEDGGRKHMCMERPFSYKDISTYLFLCIYVIFISDDDYSYELWQQE